ncbi:hypothetical protein CROQUDRAFT_281553 [Cronartium quercuum f. sp. fusiforme G11]|uniref:Uncharacterized protein n=1 Tax=Cronartium quercuum f. sp. fusiforme G11 TaxID=708437 RepID=A0A9P6T727_9BASI|nr:hypothetical protein CROQUDRAFT_281553 [Cronartium quercuum f. sp. fusiforme G11]
MSTLRILSIAVVLSSLMTVTLAEDLAHMIASLSSSCKGATAGLVTSPFGTCANVMGLVPVIGAPGSILSPLADWVTSSCTIAPCSNSTVAEAVASIDKGCADDVAKAVPAAIAISSIVANYATIRQLICAQPTNNATSCVTALFTNIEKGTKKELNITTLESVIVEGLPALVPILAALPKDQYCDDCGKELYNLLTGIKATRPPGSSTTAAAPNSDGIASAICGSSFVDGKHPSTIHQAPLSYANVSSTNITAGDSTSATSTVKAGTTAAANAPANSASGSSPPFLNFVSLFVIAYVGLCS